MHTADELSGGSSFKFFAHFQNLVHLYTNWILHYCTLITLKATTCGCLQCNTKTPGQAKHPIRCSCVCVCLCSCSCFVSIFVPSLFPPNSLFRCSIKCAKQSNKHAESSQIKLNLMSNMNCTQFCCIENATKTHFRDIYRSKRTQRWSIA